MSDDSLSAPALSAVLTQSSQLEALLDGSVEESRRVDLARSLVTQAAAAGETTWDPQERRELRRLITRWVAFLHRLSERVEAPVLAPFAGALPSLDRISAGELVARAMAGKPIIACRVEAGDLRRLNRIESLRIVDSVISDCDLSGVQLKDARLLHTTFTDCNFADSDLPGLVATSSIFNGGSLASIRAAAAAFSGTRLEAVSMRDASLQSASFAASTLRSVDARGARFDGALFDLSVVEGTRMSQAQLGGAIFTGAKLRGTDFSGSVLSLSIFSGSDVRGAVFVGAHLSEAFFSKALDVALAQFDADALTEAEFSDTDRAQIHAPQPA